MKHLQIFPLAALILILMNSCVNREIKRLARAAGEKMIERSTSDESNENNLIDGYDSTQHRPPIPQGITANVLKLKNTSNEMCAYIDSDLSATIRLAGGEDSFYKGYSSADTRATTDYFIAQGNGKKLQKKLLTYYLDLRQIAPEMVSDSISKTIIELRNPKFASLHFHKATLDAVNDLLNNYKVEIRNNERAYLIHILKVDRKK